ncbi:MAG TPA: HutP family protein [Candidatus Ornithomonoglobus intestinigallinarum]|uniref:Hut operon positive regulatory protein n=1 Tax=Candidatus Ornithomonoglobus intestinigallinarum TaxID=2840894 RepID=A0A9D1H377_9FIRM|nr:HutP family protein [Candidatus Ornithomonoglobus intestinigallinarum]
MEAGSRYVCKAAVTMAMSDDRAEESLHKERFAKKGIKTVAVDFGSDFNSAVKKILERAVVAARREGLIGEGHAEEGAVAGAAHEALQQIIDKCVGLNLGGKIGIARNDEHICVCVFFAVGLLNLNDIAIGLGHRAM